jgi:hypothetical protein
MTVRSESSGSENGLSLMLPTNRRESGRPVLKDKIPLRSVPAFAGMTTRYSSAYRPKFQLQVGKFSGHMDREAA